MSVLFHGCLDYSEFRMGAAHTRKGNLVMRGLGLGPDLWGRMGVGEGLGTEISHVDNDSVSGVHLCKETLIRTPDTDAQVNSLAGETHQCARRECVLRTEKFQVWDPSRPLPVSLRLAAPDLYHHKTVTVIQCFPEFCESC